MKRAKRLARVPFARESALGKGARMLEIGSLLLEDTAGLQIDFDVDCWRNRLAFADPLRD